MLIITDKASADGGEIEGVSVMKDKQLKLEEIAASHQVTKLGMGRSYPGEREVERVQMLLCCQVHYIQ